MPKTEFFQAYRILALLAVCVLASADPEKEWPRFILVAAYKQVPSSILETNINTGATKIITSNTRKPEGLTANAYTGTVCHFHEPTEGIICRQNSTSFFANVPQINILDRKNYKFLCQLNPFGDHLIFQMNYAPGLWIANLKTERLRRLIPGITSEFLLLQTDWENGYLLLLEEGSKYGIQVWRFNGDLGVKYSSNFGPIGNRDVTALTLDTKAMTAYWITDNEIFLTSYHKTPTNPSTAVFHFAPREIPTTILFYNDALYWHAFNEIKRLDLKSSRVSQKNLALASELNSVQSMILFEDVAGAQYRTNPCECSHICIPLKDVKYECTCPFERRLLSLPDITRASCDFPLTFSVIAQETMTTKFHFQTNDARLHIETKVLEADPEAAVIPHPYGHCLSLGNNLTCWDAWTHGFWSNHVIGSWSIDGPVLRVLELSTSDRSVIWFNGTCVKYLSNKVPETTWVFYCDQNIDPHNIILDAVNPQRSLFYRHMRTGKLIRWNLVTRSSDEIASSAQLDYVEGDAHAHMSFAVDFQTKSVYYMSASKIHKTRYGHDRLQYSATEPVVDIDRRTQKNHQLKFMHGMLYWVESRQNRHKIYNHVIVRFNPYIRARETYVRAASGFSIWSYSVQGRNAGWASIGCLRSCRKLCSQWEWEWYGDPCECEKNSSSDTLQEHFEGYCLKGVAEEVPRAVEHLTEVSWSLTAGLAVLLVFGFVLGVTLYLICRRTLKNHDADMFLNGQRGCGTSASEQNGADPVYALPFSRRIKSNKLVTYNNKPLGEGNFAVVYEGRLDGRRVAVKKLKQNHDSTTFQAFLKELKIMDYVGKHQHIVHLLGAEVKCIYEGQVFAVLEYCPNGSLDKYLEKIWDLVSAKSIDGQICETSCSIEPATDAHRKLELSDPETTVELLCHWSHQISSAMAFLTTKRVVHGDLAARNVLVFDDNILKLADFGLSRNMYQEPEYIRSRGRAIPWKWSAPEVLERSRYTLKSDVWSYGVTLWEVFEFAKSPYVGHTCDPEFVQGLKEGTIRLAKPKLMPPRVFDWLIRRCFETEPEDRINFEAVENFWVQFLSLGDEPAYMGFDDWEGQ